MAGSDMQDTARPAGRGPSGERNALHFDLGARLDKPAATVLAKSLRKALEDETHTEGRPISLDAGSVERMTTNAVQVLLAVEDAAAAVRRPLILHAPSDVFLSALADLGVLIDKMRWSIRT